MTTTLQQYYRDKKTRGQRSSRQGHPAHNIVSLSQGVSAEYMRNGLWRIEDKRTGGSGTYNPSDGRLWMSSGGEGRIRPMLSKLPRTSPGHHDADADAAGGQHVCQTCKRPFQAATSALDHLRRTGHSVFRRTKDGLKVDFNRPRNRPGHLLQGNHPHPAHHQQRSAHTHQQHGFRLAPTSLGDYLRSTRR